MIFVTGGSGFLGSHLLLDLIKAGHQVRALKRPTSDLSLCQKIFSYDAKKAEELFSQIEWVDGDIIDIGGLTEHLEGIYKVYHAAALVSFQPQDKQRMFDYNVKGTANIVNACLEKENIKLCFVSSIAALGRSYSEAYINEETDWEDSPLNSNYSKSKYRAEQEVWRGIAEGLDAVIVNPAVILGPGNWDNGSARLFKTSWKGLKFYTEGVNGYVDVRDVTKAMILLMESGISAERFILSAENISYKNFFTLCAQSLGKQAPTIKVNTFLSEIGWRILKIVSLFTGRAPFITKETARTANKKYFYSGEKIIKHIDFKYTPIAKSIDDACQLFLREINT